MGRAILAGQYIAAILLVGIFRLLPFRFSVKAGALFGALYYLIDRRHRKVALDNVKLAFGAEKSERERGAIVYGAFKNLGKTAAEFVSVQRWPPSEITSLVRVEGFEHYLAARGEGKGVLLYTAHFGSWELIPQLFACRGFPLHVIVRPLDHPYLNRLVQRWRERGGTCVLNKVTAAAEMMRLLKENATVGMLLDQNTREEDAVFVTYFGRPAATHKGMAILALRTGAPLLPVFIVREGGGHRIVIEKAWNAVKSGSLKQDMIHTTARFTQHIEAYVRRYPDHWLWVHRRWKTQPSSLKSSL